MVAHDKNQDKPITDLDKPASSSFVEEMESWFNEYLPHRFMHPFKESWPAWPDLESPFKGRFPKVDLINKDNEIIVKAELPGVKKEDLEVSLTDNMLTIKSTTQQEKKEEEGEYYRREISYGEFQRTLRLPEFVDSNKIKSSFKDGVLMMNIAKEKPTKKHNIKIE